MRAFLQACGSLELAAACLLLTGVLAACSGSGGGADDGDAGCIPTPLVPCADVGGNFGDADVGPDSPNGAVCGDDVLEGDEECDDGNLDAEDGCSPSCIVEQYEDGCTSNEQCPDGLVCIALVCTEPVELPSQSGRDVVVETAASLERRCTEGAWDEQYSDWPQAIVKLVLYVEEIGGEPVLTERQVRDNIERTNQMYARANISFRIESIRHFTAGDTIPLSNQYITGAYYGDVPSDTAVPEGYTLCGQAPLGPVAMPSFSIDADCVDGNNTTPHEIGHSLSLSHPHGGAGVKEEEADVEPLDSDCYATGTKVGDNLCDTPPDPSVTWCEIDDDEPGQCTAACDAPFSSHSPNPNLVMSYYGNTCPTAATAFTDEQYNQIHCTLQQHYRGILYHTAATPTCDDGIQNQGEAGIDCGAPCPSCPLVCQDEVCDGIDNDCDDDVDEAEDLDPLTEPIEDRCPTRGLCAVDAVQECVEGEWTCVLPEGFVADECPTVTASCAHGSLSDPTCNDDIDNDCDGVTDEHDPIVVCAEDPLYDRVGENCFEAPFGICAENGGSYGCVQLAEGCGVRVSCVGAVAPDNEQCDGLDHDCDGEVNDRNDIDGDGYGDCSGHVDCDETTRGRNPGVTEVCDLIDNNCRNGIDEGVLNACGGCGPVPTDTCGDWVDNDCNGVVDQGCTRNIRMTVERVEALYSDCSGDADMQATLALSNGDGSNPIAQFFGPIGGDDDISPFWSLDFTAPAEDGVVQGSINLSDDQGGACGSDDVVDIHPSAGESRLAFWIDTLTRRIHYWNGPNVVFIANEGDQFNLTGDGSIDPPYNARIYVRITVE